MLTLTDYAFEHIFDRAIQIARCNGFKLPVLFFHLGQDTRALFIRLDFGQHLAGLLLCFCLRFFDQALGFLFGNDRQLLRFLQGSVMNFLRTFFYFNDLLNLFLVHNSLLTEWSLLPWTIWTQL